MRRRGRRNLIHQGIEVAQIVGEAITLLRPLAAPEAAPVGRDDRPLLAKGIDNELKCLARIQPSMQQEKRRLLRRGIPNLQSFDRRVDNALRNDHGKSGRSQFERAWTRRVASKRNGIRRGSDYQ